MSAPRNVREGNQQLYSYDPRKKRINKKTKDHLPTTSKCSGALLVTPLNFKIDTENSHGERKIPVPKPSIPKICPKILGFPRNIILLDWGWDGWMGPWILKASKGWRFAHSELPFPGGTPTLSSPHDNLHLQRPEGLG